MSRPASHALDRLPRQTVRHLKDIAPSGLRDWVSASAQTLIEVNLEGCTDKRSVLQAVARDFTFPSWFGMNLDALYDALTDLPEQRPAAGYVILLEHLPRTDGFGADERAALLDVFRDAAESYAEQGIPFRVLYS
ncbi:MAG TPA: barstar family protein [Burkholderiaceae bacterium]|nr:barstar family protein [Burkholderiaceae bacterium]HQR69442.1 barstar family protein [Burkholderiaceae bacterium]